MLRGLSDVAFLTFCNSLVWDYAQITLVNSIYWQSERIIDISLIGSRGWVVNIRT